MASPVQRTSGNFTGAQPSTRTNPYGFGAIEDAPCTEKCRSKEHGLRVWQIALGGEGDGVVCLWAKTCLNYAQAKDEFGRTSLIAAASTGDLKAVEWLIKTQQININAKDYISGYTALHRSIYFGHLHVTRALMSCERIDVNVRDHENLTPFELCQLDRPRIFKQNKGDLTELTVWGSNANYNLGLGHQQPRLHPDFVPEFRRPEMSLKKVEMNTYHTIFLTQQGKVFSCGYGVGRLGTGSDEEVILKPSLVQLRNDGACRDIAAGVDHSIFLTETKVWTVGSNEYGQLGMQLGNLKNPRTVDTLQKYGITGILAGSYHSCFYNSTTILMCGQNQGQFGKGFEEQTIVPVPSKLRVSLENVGNGTSTITNVGGNEFCTAICIDRRHVFLMRRHQCIRIDSRNTTSQEILKIQASGEKHSITLFMLTGSGRLLVYRENFNKTTNECKGAFTRLVFTRLYDITDFSISLSSLVFATSTGEAYKAGWNPNNPPSIVGHMEDRFGQVAAADFQIALRQRRGKKEDEASPCIALELMKVKRVPNVYTALSVCSDLKGNNWSILQRHPMMDVTDIPLVNETRMINDLKELYLEVGEGDITFCIDSFHQYPAHRLVVANGSRAFRDVLTKNPTSSLIQVTSKLFSLPSSSASIENPKIFQSVLEMIYTRQCYYVSLEFMTLCYQSSMEEGKKKGGKYGDLLRELSRFKSLCRGLGMDECETFISRYSSDLEAQWDLVVNEGRQPRFNFNQYLHQSDVNFRLDLGNEFSDVLLESTDKVSFEVDKCLLTARSEYFKSMFSMNWSFGQEIQKDSGRSKILLPFSSKAITILLEWVYSNSATSLKDADTELICETLGCADYVMSDQLIEICESEIVSRITLKNVVDVLVFAWKHNGAQLKNTCYEFIALNLTAMLENKLLDSLPVEVMIELSDYYRRLQKNCRMLNRGLTSCGPVPEASEYEEAVKEISEEILGNLQVIEEVDNTDIILKKYQNKTSKSRVRLRSRTYSETEVLVEQQQEDQATAEKKEKSPVVDATNHLANSKSIESPKGLELKTRNSSFSSNSNKSPIASAVNQGPISSETMSSGRKFMVPLPKNTGVMMKTPEKKIVTLKPDDFPSLDAGVALNPSLAVGTSITPVKSIQFGKLSCPNISPSGSSSGGKRKTKWRAVKAETEIPYKNSPGISGSGACGGVAGDMKTTNNLTADGRDRSNPWKRNENSESQTVKVAFKAIVEDEVEKKRNLEKATNKSLPLMQIEDEVINHLTDRYSSEDTKDFIELLTVERVITSNFSAPTWVQHPGALTSSFPVK